MFYLILSSVIIFITFLTAMYSLYGILPSVSDSYYNLPKEHRYLFTIFCWGMSIPLLIAGTIMTDNYFLFIASSGTMFVGVASEFRQKMTKTVHLLGAYVSIIFSHLSIIIDFNMIEVSAIVLGIVLAMYKSKVKNRIYWIEILSYFTLIYVLISNL
jgi:hypothetical protein